MGPIALFDKSFLQSLSIDEAVWFDKFFMPVVCPVFYAETLGDLAKEPSKLGTAEVIVRRIADKFPELGGSPCEFHGQICLNDLLDVHHMPMDGRVPRPGGRPVEKGVVYERTPAEEAFARWHQGKFHEVERIVAASFRNWTLVRWPRSFARWESMGNGSRLGTFNHHLAGPACPSVPATNCRAFCVHFS
jgi:hypothetical protein